MSCGSKRDFGNYFLVKSSITFFNVNLNFGMVLSEENILRMYKYETIHCLKQAVKVGLLLVVHELQ